MSKLDNWWTNAPLLWKMAIVMGACLLLSFIGSLPNPTQLP